MGNSHHIWWESCRKILGTTRPQASPWAACRICCGFFHALLLGDKFLFFPYLLHPENNEKMGMGEGEKSQEMQKSFSFFLLYLWLVYLSKRKFLSLYERQITKSINVREEVFAVFTDDNVISEGHFLGPLGNSKFWVTLSDQGQGYLETSMDGGYTGFIQKGPCAKWWRIVRNCWPELWGWEKRKQENIMALRVGSVVFSLPGISMSWFQHIPSSCAC